MAKKNPFGYDESGKFGDGMQLPPEVLQLQNIISPWMEACMHFTQSIDSMERHMGQAARIYDIQDLVDAILEEYKPLALSAVGLSCSEEANIPAKREIVRELDRLANTTVMWPKSWPKWITKHYLRMSVVSPCRDLEVLWAPTMAKLRDFRIPEWMHTNMHDIVSDPLPMLRDILSDTEVDDAQTNKCYENVCRHWLILVKEGISESVAGNQAMRWFKDRKIGPMAPSSTDAELEALLGPTPPDMPMDGRAK